MMTKTIRPDENGNIIIPAGTLKEGETIRIEWGNIQPKEVEKKHFRIACEFNGETYPSKYTQQFRLTEPQAEALAKAVEGLVEFVKDPDVLEKVYRRKTLYDVASDAWAAFQVGES